MAYIDQNSQSVNPGRQIGRRGGEGTVYEAISHPGHVVKFYHQPPDDLKASKLGQMVQTATPEVLSFAAWPKLLVWDPKGNLRGFLMPAVQGKEIHELYGPKERFLNFPSARWDFLVHVARNCASAFDEIHKTGSVIGDVNEGNLLVKRDGTVCIIDCDSFQASASNGFVWTCDVGVPLWTSPELQGKPFRGLQRTVNHDLFGLAVLIFRILFMGRHPYAGIPLTSTDLPLEKAIAEYRYAYSDNPQQLGVQTPPNTLPISTLPVMHREMFARAFLRGSEQDGQRPSAADWVGALDSLRATLAACKRDSAHRLPSNLSLCPWCKIADDGGPNFFLAVYVQGANGQVSVSMWEAIGNISPLSPLGWTMSNLPTVDCEPAALPPAETTFRKQFIAGIVIVAVGILFLFGGSWVIGLALALLGGGFIYEGPYLYTYSSIRRRVSLASLDKEKQLEAELIKLQKIEEEARRLFTEKKEQSRKTYERLIHLEQEKKAALAELQTQKRQLQLDAFLDGQLLGRARIPGIGPRLVSELLSYGVESALDVPRAMRVPGIGPAKYQQLLRWRATCEAQFRFDANAPLPQAVASQVNAKFASIRQTLESELRQAPSILQRINTSAGAAREPIASKIQGLTKECCQLVANLSSIPEY